MRRPKFGSALENLIATDEGEAALITDIVDRDERLRADTTRHGGPSLFGEVLDFMLAPLLLLWPISIIVTLFIARSLADAPYDEALRERAVLLSQQIQFVPNTSGGFSAHVPSATHGLLARDSLDLRYDVRDSAGKRIFANADLPIPALYDFPLLRTVQFRTVTSHESDLRVAYTYVSPSGDDNYAGRPALVQVAEQFEQRRELASRIIRGVIFPQFVILPLAAALVWFGLTRGLQPIRGLRDRILGRRPDDLSPIDASIAPQELMPLLESFNDLLARLGQNMTTQRRFIADAAHQIKTPLAGIRLQAELALRASNESERRQSLEQLANSSLRASHLVNQLLALARAENTHNNAPLAPADLTSLTRSVLTEQAPMAIEAQLDIGFEAPEASTIVRGNDVLIGELVGNLISNAIRYTPAGGQITVRIKAELAKVHLDVEDNGPGIPTDERAAVFERFYRLRDRPASNEAEARGSGLGLAIVREIAQVHNAQIVIEDGAPWPSERGVGRGTLISIRFDEYRERFT